MSRLYLYGGIALALFLAGFGSAWTIQGWRLQARQTAAVEAALAVERQQSKQVIASLQADIRASQESSNGLQAELIRLRNQPSIPAVRVSKPASCPPAKLPAESTAASGSDAGPETGGVVQKDPDGRNIGPVLELLVAEGDRCSAQLRALQGWIQATSDATPSRTPPPPR